MKQLEIHKLRKKLIIFIFSAILLLLMLGPSLATSQVDANRQEPEESQYFEMRAVEVNEIEGKNKQIIMQLWGHNIDFKRI